ncbi:EAL domain-containing protein [Nitratiruptor sp. YY09-18]|uniref:EAL domain-containing protein n=1 Tax=Nitratiruptor sp. YY09-18 TaxID=2724901 RepID=UPI001915FFE6|nr:EAL domain-containing protein [Nitratiruptor sp. YY09-18]BCD68769.1 diguanylate cyclase/phosphodiesterase [Nitratiruptor sp. YY09-18]
MPKRLRSIALTLVLAFITLGLLFYYEHFAKAFFTNKHGLYTTIYSIYELETDLNYQLLKTSFYLYDNYDELANTQKELIKKIDTLINQLLANNYIDLADEVKKYKKAVEQRIEAISHYLILNSTMKNSLIFLANLTDNLPKTLNSEEKQKLLELILETVIYKNTFDKTYLAESKATLQNLEKSLKKSEDGRHLLHHLQLIVKSFPIYSQQLNGIINTSTLTTLKEIEKRLHKRIEDDAKKVNLLFFITILFFLLAIFLIIYFIWRLDRENRALRALEQKLRQSAITDDLTNLYNRRAFKVDVRKIKTPFFALVNINGFKHYNDFYGNRVGDHILREVAKALQTIIPPKYNAKLYRVGGDDFGILIEEETPIDDATFAKRIIEYFNNNKIVFKSAQMYITVSIGITRKRPLLETADMALKFVKQNINLLYFTYDERIGFFDQIKKNIQRSKILKEAIDQNNIIPYYQPIIDNTNGKIIKYEVLARLKHNNTIESIHPYLEIAKEIRLYRDITLKITQKSFIYAYEYKKPIAINISMRDIEDPQVISFFGKIFEQYPGIEKLVTFEILESETLSDYNAVKDFISIVRGYGCEVALDDFGSGYSNFAHVFNLDIDYLKIDGSLIQTLPHDENAKLIVSAIIYLAKKSGIKTVAEFVSSKEILEEVKTLGIDYSQGYFLAKPQPKF